MAVVCVLFVTHKNNNRHKFVLYLLCFFSSTFVNTSVFVLLTVDVPASAIILAIVALLFFSFHSSDKQTFYRFVTCICWPVDYCNGCRALYNQIVALPLFENERKKINIQQLQTICIQSDYGETLKYKRNIHTHTHQKKCKHK